MIPPFLAFLRSNVAGGAVLFVAACVALAWSNSPLAPSYDALISAPLGLTAGAWRFTLPLRGWVNDGLMALFFLLVGLEIRREMREGELASLRRVAAPGLAALGGMVAPAAIYIAFNHADPVALRGWAVPVATDIAFALAALSLLGNRVPSALKLFLTALAIIDDIGAILVIALFYTHGLDWTALAVAVGTIAVLTGLAIVGVRALSPYLLGGIVLWAAIHRSGIHPTLAGVALAFIVPAGSPAHRLETALEHWVAYAVLPLFGLANAGLHLGGLSLRIALDPLVLGIAAGLVLGKQMGVFGVTWLACRLHVAHLPDGMSWRVLYGGSLLCGIGFTMSLFIGGLAFPTPDREAEVKLAVFTGSLLSAALGLLVLGLAARRPLPR